MFSLHLNLRNPYVCVFDRLKANKFNGWAIGAKLPTSNYENIICNKILKQLKAPHKHTSGVVKKRSFYGKADPYGQPDRKKTIFLTTPLMCLWEFREVPNKQKKR